MLRSPGEELGGWGMVREVKFRGKRVDNGEGDRR